MPSGEQTSLSQAFDAIDETIATAQKIRAALAVNNWQQAFQLVLELGINTTQAVAFVSAVSMAGAGLEAMRANKPTPP